MNEDNPLLKAFDLPEFSKIKIEHFRPAILEAIKIARSEIESIASIKVPDFSNTIEALDTAGYQLERITQVLFNLNSAETNDQIQQIAQEVSPLLSDFQNDIMSNKSLFENVKAVFDVKEKLDLSDEQLMLLDKNYKSFVRNGALLNENDQKTLREIDNKLSTLTLEFGQHVLDDTNAYELHVMDKDDLKGLSAQQLEEAKETAKEKGKKGYVFTLHYPSYIPFMKFCENRNLRRELYLAFGKRGFQNNKNNNENTIKAIVSLRDKRAKLLGFETHAHYVLQERMAKSPENVHNFLDELLVKSKPFAENELKEIKAFAKETDNLQTLAKWDLAFYTEKLKQKRFNLDDNILKPFFPLGQVVEGVFEIANRLYGLSFEQTHDIEVYHKDVNVYRVFDKDKTFKAIFFTDFHPRAGKRGGAWMTIYKSQFKTEDTDERPQVSIVCNFSKPGKDTPALLTFNEVTTLFHEFGHALHGMLANTTYRSLSGTSVRWDFVELPSQILENWCYQQEALELFARHYKTGEAIPQKYIEQIKAASNFNEGMQTLRQLSFGLLDLAWHTSDPSKIKDVKAFESEAFQSTKLLDEMEETCMSTAFSHIFQGGYSAGYYSYKWAEVLDADAFEAFKEKGIFNKDVAKSFHDNILSKGGTQEPMQLYKKFRGKEPDPQALLTRAGMAS
jgi:Zn-dependent oligopeptidase